MPVLSHLSNDERKTEPLRCGCQHPKGPYADLQRVAQLAASACAWHALETAFLHPVADSRCEAWQVRSPPEYLSLAAGRTRQPQTHHTGLQYGFEYALLFHLGCALLGRTQRPTVTNMQAGFAVRAQARLLLTAGELHLHECVLYKYTTF